MANERKFQKDSHRFFLNVYSGSGNGDTFYIFTDGYCDQFGGEEDNKYLDDNFEKLLLKIQNQTMPEQAISIEAEINAWKGNGPQIDDMLVIGIRC